MVHEEPEPGEPGVDFVLDRVELDEAGKDLEVDVGHRIQWIVQVVLKKFNMKPLLLS